MDGVPEKLADGKIVELGDFGAPRITDTHVIFTPGKRFKQLLATIEFQKEAGG